MFDVSMGAAAGCEAGLREVVVGLADLFEFVGCAAAGSLPDPDVDVGADCVEGAAFLHGAPSNPTTLQVVLYKKLSAWIGRDKSPDVRTVVNITLSKNGKNFLIFAPRRNDIA